jgi:hypothetical protein
MSEKLKKLSGIFILVFTFATGAHAVAPPPVLVLKNQYGEQTTNRVLNYQGGALQSASVVLTPAQVIAMGVTPIQLVGSVANQIIQVNSVEIAFAKGSVAFSVGSPSVDKMIVQYHSSAIPVASVLESGLIDQSVSTEADLFGFGAGGVGIRGEAVELVANGSVGEITGGTGSSVKATIFYNILN